MKYVLTNEENIIIDISSTYNHDKEKRNIKLDNHNIAYAPNEVINVYEVEIPSNVELQKYCYTSEQGFYKNENYKEHYSLEEQVSALEDMVNELILGGL